MAATRGTVQGFTKNSDYQNGPASRLGHGSVKVTAATWRTFATTYVDCDGSGHVLIIRDGETLHKFEFGPE